MARDASRPTKGLLIIFSYSAWWSDLFNTQGCDSSARELVDISAFNDWGAYCDHLAQPAQGAGGE